MLRFKAVFSRLKLSSLIGLYFISSSAMAMGKAPKPDRYLGNYQLVHQKISDSLHLQIETPIDRKLDALCHRNLKVSWVEKAVKKLAHLNFEGVFDPLSGGYVQMKIYLDNKESLSTEAFEQRQYRRLRHTFIKDSGTMMVEALEWRSSQDPLAEWNLIQQTITQMQLSEATLEITVSLRANRADEAQELMTCRYLKVR